MEGILVAKTEEKQLIYITDSYNREELQRMRQLHTFYCPDCGKDMLLKIGDVKVPHFAHRTLSACGSSEPESPTHLQGKVLLHQFFIRKKIPAEVEMYFPEIRQRADIFVDRQTAIEFQCSPISASDIVRRSSAYLNFDLECIWIAGTQKSLENQIQIIKLLEYQKEMLLQHNRLNYLILLNPGDKHFHYYSNLFYISGNRWVGKVAALPIDKQSYPFAIPKALSCQEFDSIITVFSHIRASFIKTQQYAKKRYQNPFWLLCYELQLDMRNLPETIGVPIYGSDILMDHPVIWQLKIMRACRQGVSIESLLNGGTIKIRKKVNSRQAAAVLNDYASFLKKIEELGGDSTAITDTAYDIYCKNIGKLRKYDVVRLPKEKDKGGN